MGEQLSERPEDAVQRRESELGGGEASRRALLSDERSGAFQDAARWRLVIERRPGWAARMPWDNDSQSESDGEVSTLPLEYFQIGELDGLSRPRGTDSDGGSEPSSQADAVSTGVGSDSCSDGGSDGCSDGRSDSE